MARKPKKIDLSNPIHKTSISVPTELAVKAAKRWPGAVKDNPITNFSQYVTWLIRRDTEGKK